MSDLKLEGVYVPVVTPFDADEGLDLSTLTKVVDFCLDAGVSGVVSCGTTGEYYAMSFDERKSVMAHTSEVVGDRAVLVAGCNAGSTREAIRLAEAAVAVDYDAIMLAVPPTSLPSQTAALDREHVRGFATDVGGRAQAVAVVDRRITVGLPKGSRHWQAHHAFKCPAYPHATGKAKSNSSGYRRYH